MDVQEGAPGAQSRLEKDVVSHVPQPPPVPIPYLSQTRVLRCRDVEQGEGGRGRESRIADPKCGGPLRVIWEALIPQGCLFQQQLWQQSRVWG